MSLLSEPWMPVRDRSGGRRWISPAQLADPDIVAFDADRADFNGALTQFAIGLLTTFAPLSNERDWQGWFANPPAPYTLQSWWSSHEAVFVFDGDGARFMQDRTLSAKPEFSISGLLIDSPGENTIKINRDHFVKRGRIEHLCPQCAVTALFALQINAPSGGAGHRTGLRGGGPLTTLLTCEPPRSLWHDLWLNVMEPPQRDAHGGDPRKSAPHFTFPWLEPIGAIQPEQGQTSPIQVHPMHIHWAMPRRIRLDFEHVSEGDCDICHRQSQRLLSQYTTAPHGLNYEGPWDHVLSPYYKKGEDWIPFHPQPGGIGYRHWLPWLVGSMDEKSPRRPARVVTHFHATRRARQTGVKPSLWAFGYDMKKFEARCWYESRLPTYDIEALSEHEIGLLQSILQSFLAGAEYSVEELRDKIKAAWFGGEARGDYSAVDAAFWSRTERPFYELLPQLLEAIRAGASDDALISLTEAWLRVLQVSCKALFEDVFVGAGQVDRSDPRRVATAHKTLLATLHGPKLRNALKLPTQDAKPAKK